MKNLYLLIAIWLMAVNASSQQVYFTPPMVDTAALEKTSYLDSSFHPFFELTNKGKTPLHFRFLLNWPGHEHILDSDSALFAFIAADPVNNLAAILKTPYSGVNQYPVRIIDDPHSEKKFRLVEFMEGFEGRLCNDYANLAYYVLNKLGYKVEISGTEHHTFNNLEGTTEEKWLAIDFDPHMPVLNYDVNMLSVILNKNLMLSRKIFSDSVTPYKGVSMPGAISPQVFWQTCLTGSANPRRNDYTPQAENDTTIASTSNELILPPGASFSYVVNNNSIVLNADLPKWNKFKNELNDTLNQIAWNSNPSPREYLETVHEAFTSHCRKNPGDAFMLHYLKGLRIKWQNDFGADAQIAIQDMNYQLLTLVIPPHTDTLWAGKDYRVPFWIEKSVINKTVVPGLCISDSMKTVSDRLQARPWQVRNSQVQTLTQGYLAPSTSTTYIYLHFNTEIIPLLTGAEYQVISGDKPEVVTSFKHP